MVHLYDPGLKELYVSEDEQCHRVPREIRKVPARDSHYLATLVRVWAISSALIAPSDDVLIAET